MFTEPESTLPGDISHDGQIALDRCGGVGLLGTQMCGGELGTGALGRKHDFFTSSQAGGTWFLFSVPEELIENDKRTKLKTSLSSGEMDVRVWENELPESSELAPNLQSRRNSTVYWGVLLTLGLGAVTSLQGRVT